jgi:hypothetical protein
MPVTQSAHTGRRQSRQLSGVKRTRRRRRAMSAYDSKRTSSQNRAWQQHGRLRRHVLLAFASSGNYLLQRPAALVRLHCAGLAILKEHERGYCWVDHGSLAAATAPIFLLSAFTLRAGIDRRLLRARAQGKTLGRPLRAPRWQFAICESSASASTLGAVSFVDGRSDEFFASLTARFRALGRTPIGELSGSMRTRRTTCP